MLVIQRTTCSAYPSAIKGEPSPTSRALMSRAVFRFRFADSHVINIKRAFATRERVAARTRRAFAMLASNASVKQVGRTLSRRIIARFMFSLESRRYPTMLAALRPHPVGPRPLQLEQYFNRLAIPEGRMCLPASNVSRYRRRRRRRCLPWEI